MKHRFWNLVERAKQISLRAVPTYNSIGETLLKQTFEMLAAIFILFQNIFPFKKWRMNIDVQVYAAFIIPHSYLIGTTRCKRRIITVLTCTIDAVVRIFIELPYVYCASVWITNVKSRFFFQKSANEIASNCVFFLRGLIEFFSTNDTFTLKRIKFIAYMYTRYTIYNTWEEEKNKIKEYIDSKAIRILIYRLNTCRVVGYVIFYFTFHARPIALLFTLSSYLKLVKICIKNSKIKKKKKERKGKSYYAVKERESSDGG